MYSQHFLHCTAIGRAMADTGSTLDDVRAAMDRQDVSHVPTMEIIFESFRAHSKETPA